MPGADNLHVIGQRTDVSLDWLVGFDVPRFRKDRTQVADVGEVLRSRLNEIAALIVHRGVAGAVPSGDGGSLLSAVWRKRFVLVGYDPLELPVLLLQLL